MAFVPLADLYAGMPSTRPNHPLQEHARMSSFLQTLLSGVCVVGDEQQATQGYLLVMKQRQQLLKKCHDLIKHLSENNMQDGRSSSNITRTAVMPRQYRILTAYYCAAAMARCRDFQATSLRCYRINLHS
jgi:hypothetical protein